MHARVWAGQLTMAPGWALFVGQPGDNALHAHQAIQICLSACAPLSVAIGEQERVRAAAVAIAPNVPHAIQPDAGAAALLYLDPNGNDGRSAGECIGTGGFQIAPVDRLEGLQREIAVCADEEWSEARSHGIRDQMLGLWVDRAREAHPATDPRVEAAIRSIRAAVSRRRIAAAELAREVGISQSRLSNLFRRHAGVAIRPFVLWTRLQRAIETVGEGRSLTEAAHEAGFADSAHLSRTFRRMFGTTLSAGVGRLRIQLIRE